MLTSDCYAYGEIFEEDSKQIQKETAEAEAEFHAAMASRAKILGWRSAVLVTPLADHLARAARRADLVLTNAASDHALNAARQVNVGDLVMQAGRPILVVAPAPAPFRMDRVIIGWKDTREARRATADAIPLLQAAKNVGIVEIAAEDEREAAKSRLGEVARWLARHGVRAECEVRASTRDEPTDLDAIADERRADIVVAGAYGHSRLREWALGGVTRTLLRQAARSSFVSH